MQGEAVFDKTRQYRYSLSRSWMLGDGVCVFVMLNPSTADASVLDPTVRRCVRYAQRWGFRRLEVLNIFAWRSTDPSVLSKLDDPVGPDNMKWIVDIATRPTTSLVVCAWGKHGQLLGQGQKVVELLTAKGVELWCLGTNGDGTPVHPLYQPNDAALKRFA